MGTHKHGEFRCQTHDCLLFQCKCWGNGLPIHKIMCPGEDCPGAREEAEKMAQDSEELENVRVAEGLGGQIVLQVALPERANREGDSQGLPTKNDLTDTQAWMIDWISKRRELGIRRYGTGLQPFNGRDSILDALEEAGDLFTYLANLYREQQQRLLDHEHEDLHATLSSIIRRTIVTARPEEFATAILSQLAASGYVIIREEHA